MTTILILTILIPVVALTVVVVYRGERRTEHLSRVPMQIATSRRHPRRVRSAGPDAARIDVELDTLLLLRRDGG